MIINKSFCDGGTVKLHLQLFEHFFFTFNSNIFLVIYLVFKDAQVYTGLALFLVSENNILNAFAKIMGIVAPLKPLEINLCLKII